MGSANPSKFTLFTPSADQRRYSPHNGEYSSVWFDRSPNFVNEGVQSIEDTLGTDKSLDKVLDTINSIENQFDHIFLGGFSMGGGLALHALRANSLTSKCRGIFSISSFLVNSSSVFAPGPPGHRPPPVLMMHGEADSFINCDWGRKTAANLLLKDIDVQFRTYSNVAHELAEEEVPTPTIPSTILFNIIPY
jgi:predicted esterase